MPWNRADYPDDWDRIRARILKRAGDARRGGEVVTRRVHYDQRRRRFDSGPRRASK